MSDKNTSDKGKATLAQDYAGRIVPLIRQAPWVLRVTEHRDRTGPVLVIKERISAEERDDAAQLTAPRSVTRERGVLHGESQRRCLLCDEPAHACARSRRHDTDLVVARVEQMIDAWFARD